MRWLIVLLLLSSAFAFRPDGFCNRTAGESCMDSNDCKICNVSLTVNTTYHDTMAMLSARVKNYEPAELPLVVILHRDGELIEEEEIDLLGGESRVLAFELERDPDNSTLLINVRDRDIHTAWAFYHMTLPGLETAGGSEILVPLVGVVLFIGIIFYGFKRMRETGPGPYQMQPVFFPSYPQEPQEEEEIIIVPKKKKYYYRKD